VNDTEINMKIDSNITVSELMARHPSVIDVFIKRKMICVGCPCQAFHTIEEVTSLHGYDREDFLEAIRKTVESKKNKKAEGSD